VRHRDAHAAKQLNAFRDVVDEPGLFLRVFVEQQVELIERVSRHRDHQEFLTWDTGELLGQE